MANKSKDKYKDIPEYPGPGPEHPRCGCVLYVPTDEEMLAIVKEVDRMIMETLKVADMTEYYEALEGHNERRH